MKSFHNQQIKQISQEMNQQFSNFCFFFRFSFLHLLCSYIKKIYILVVSKPKPTPNASSTAAHPALMHPLAAGRKY